MSFDDIKDSILNLDRTDQASHNGSCAAGMGESL